MDGYHAVATVVSGSGRNKDYLDDGNLIIAMLPRIDWVGVIGHLLFNLGTDEVALVAGKEFGNVVLACEAPT
ncbi:MAG: hypothetical protein ABI037_12105 [Gemmatimonadales bacterium]